MENKKRKKIINLIASLLGLFVAGWGVCHFLNIKPQEVINLCLHVIHSTIDWLGKGWDKNWEWQNSSVYKDRLPKWFKNEISDRNLTTMKGRIENSQGGKHFFSFFKPERNTLHERVYNMKNSSALHLLVYWVLFYLMWIISSFLLSWIIGLFWSGKSTTIEEEDEE